MALGLSGRGVSPSENGAWRVTLPEGLNPSNKALSPFIHPLRPLPGFFHASVSRRIFATVLEHLVLA